MLARPHDDWVEPKEFEEQIVDFIKNGVVYEKATTYRLPD